jgi:regulator of cell morphogenesis and NO signaling
MPIQRPFTPDLTISEVARQLPNAISVFEEMEIDYSCHGGKSLIDAAREAGYRVDELIERLAAAGNNGQPTNWFQEPLPALVQYLNSDHRATIGKRIPDLSAEIEEAIVEIGAVRELLRIRILFGHLAKAMSTHVLNEERELFPFIHDLDAANNDLLGAPKMRISQRVLRELVEHESFRDSLHTLRELAARLPGDGAVRKLRDDLRDFSNEVNRHMHLENNVLYPRAIEIENGLRRTAAATA